MTGPRAPRRRRLAPENRRSEILAAALDLFARRPADQVSVEDVAAAAGASPALVHHYFGSKPELAQQVLQATADEIITQLQVDPTRPPAEQLATSLAVYLDYLAEHPKSWNALLLAGQSADNPTAAVAAAVDDHAIGLLLRAAVPDEDEPMILRIALRGWLALVKDACLRWLDGELDRPSLEKLLIGSFLGCLTAAARADGAAAPALSRFS